MKVNVAAAPLALEAVVTSVASLIRRHPRNDEWDITRFVVAGSYPASVCARRSGLSLPYSEIDVYLEQKAKPRLTPRDGTMTLLVSWGERNVVPGCNVRVNFVLYDKLDLARLIDSFDINCILCGLEVHCNQDWGVQSMRWDIRREFCQFLLHRELKIVNFDGLARPAPALVRLLYKAQQLKLPFVLPAEQAQVRKIHGGSFSGGNIGRFEALGPSYREKISSRFRNVRFHHPVLGSELMLLESILGMRSSAGSTALLY